jgi:hypothetical protein
MIEHEEGVDAAHDERKLIWIAGVDTLDENLDRRANRELRESRQRSAFVR